MNEIESLVGRYQKWLRDKTVIKRIHEWAEITTPFLDRHNDYVQLYVKKVDNGYLLTDDGYTLNDLEASGCALDSDRRKALLETTLNGFGVRREGQALLVHATADNFAIRKHSLIQAVLAVNDLFVLAPPFTQSLFLEDVAAWLAENDVRYVPRVRLPGASGFDHMFDFAIPRSRSGPERLVRAISSPSRDKAENFAFAWVDTESARRSREAAPIAYAIINDNERPVAANVTDALDAYSIRVVAWSKRQSAVAELAA